ncbi:DUF1931 family protein [Mesorhizobium sp. AR10]|uniref:DUF1931 family protein n=1 Tax=Mesorhizobium sp. AR10 TaxID=2865839 RepID=UPI00215DE7BF|nr:DUF1931 family protein [Mesorhizobium sp. AR10]UVK40998.1 DUF1931 family protein [Mesorhizobium sp. AR10]
MTRFGVHKIQRLFRKAAELDVDKADIARYQDFVNRKLYDMLLIAEARARANGNLVIEPQDLPITKGLQESVQAFKRIDAELEVTPIIDHIAGRPPLDIAISYETDEHFAEIAGGLSYALAKTFVVLQPDLKNPQTRHWDQAFRMFDLLL